MGELPNWRAGYDNNFSAYQAEKGKFKGLKDGG